MGTSNAAKIITAAHQTVLRSTCGSRIVARLNFQSFPRLLGFSINDVFLVYLVLPFLVRDAVAKFHSRKVYGTVERYPCVRYSLVKKRVQMFPKKIRLSDHQIPHLKLSSCTECLTRNRIYKKYIFFCSPQTILEPRTCLDLEKRRS